MSESSRLLWIDCNFVLGQEVGAAGNADWLLPPEAWLPTGQASQFLISVEADISGYGALAPSIDLALETPTAQSPRTDAFEVVGAPLSLSRGHSWGEFDVGRRGADAAVRGALRLRATNAAAADACVRLRVWVAGQTLVSNGPLRTWGR